MPEYRLELHKSIFNFITFGKGGWTWDNVYYDMPVFLRNFYMKQMVEVIERENNPKGETEVNGRTKILRPDVPRR